jgi:hypothetical protein
VRNLHRHEERVARFEPKALATYLGNELPAQDIEPFILLMVNVQRSADIRTARRVKG